MFQLDENFLNDIGLGNLPEEQKKPFLQHIYEQLEYQVGISLSEGMTDAQLEEFEGIIDRKPEVVRAWIQAKAPNFQSDELFSKLQQASGLEVNDPNLHAEYAATKWLEINRPDYREVVSRTLEDIKQEVITNRDAIMGTPPAAA